MMNKDYLKKYLNNRCSGTEFDHIVESIGEEVKDKEIKRLSFAFWNKMQSDEDGKDDKKFAVLLDKIHHRINLDNSKAVKRATSFQKVVIWSSRVAAILFIPVFISLLYLLSLNNFQIYGLSESGYLSDLIEVKASAGSQTQVHLVDGTIVNLNYGSVLRYPSHFYGETREVSIQGEGYFNVAHNAAKPFIVKTGKINIKVLGTEFNVEAYPDNAIVSATLVKGKVELDKVLSEGKVAKIGAMTPGQHVDYNVNTDDIVSKKVDVDRYIAWKEGKMVFDNTPIQKVIQELERKYNVDVHVAKDVEYLTYTQVFGDDSLSLILDLMSEVTPIKYKILPRERLADGSFAKQKIKIEKR